MKMMTTGRNLQADDACHTAIHCWLENSVQQVKEFVYIFHLTFTFGTVLVDDHNNLCYALPFWEDTWVYSLVKASCVFIHFHDYQGLCLSCHRNSVGKEHKPKFLIFCKKIDWHLILDLDLIEETVSFEYYQMAFVSCHTPCPASQHAHEYCNCQWIYDVSQHY